MRTEKGSPMLSPQDFFDLKDFEHQGIFSGDEAVWTALNRLKDYLTAFFQKSWPLSGVSGQIDKALVIYNGEVRDDFDVKATGRDRSIRTTMKGEVLEGAAVILPGAFLFDDRITIGPGTIVEPGALIKGPVVIGNDCEIRQGAYIRGDCLVGNRCVVGHTTEMKGSIMLDGAKAAHFAYVGDCILGKDVNLGAGTKLANLKMIPGSISITADGKRYDTGRRKLGAILGDRTETGCNSVTSPGTLLGPGSIVYAGLAVPGGYYPSKTIIMPSQDSLRIHRPNRLSKS
jgi:UDP-N-acetylglucosamine diphosphorylase / glucose-1-phosphate thymidylyltransferase / UDP-N-acetylgalactosamine diphosphorylase / glucosamine-1-phosphate N-acetyltransferase / galactosamine-1-phosphate N-acetyltransferase